MRATAGFLPLMGMVSAMALEVRADSGNGCSNLSRHFSEDVFYPGSPVYGYESQNFWSNTELMSPACVFRPQSSSQLAKAVGYLADGKEKFAVRGGGHMGIKGSNNIDDGALIVMSNLTTLELSEDQSTVSIGPGHRWSDVYEYLDEHYLVAAGGRLGSVGVPGLLLAGGVHFYGNQIGWACDNVLNYEVVLADGSLVEANKTHHPDLFWALKGGGNNFGLVTRFDMQTVTALKIWGGTHTVSAKHIDRLLEASAKYAANNEDPRTHVVPAIIPGEQNTASVILFYDSPQTSYPESLKAFTDIPAIQSTLGFKTLAELTTETDAMIVPRINDVFVGGTVVGTTYEELHKGISITNRTFFSSLPELYEKVPKTSISLIEIDWQPIGASWMKASAARGGNALGLDPSKVYICFAQVVEWVGSEYDEAVASWVQSTQEKIDKATKQAGVYDPFVYMGDAAGFQSVFEGYSQENHNRLQAIAKRYDPHGVFQNLMPGGFKVF